MKKVFKWVGIIILLLLIIAISIPFIFKDKIIEKVKTEANKNLNAKLDFGEFDLSILKGFPDVKLTLENLSISGINEFKGDTLISVKHLAVNLDIMSVIKGDQYEIKDIILDHPRIRAKVLKDGKANWEITKPDPTPSTDDAASSPFKMSLKKFEIIDGFIVYDDAQSNMQATIANLDHSLSGDFTQDNFTLETLTSMDQLDFIYGGVKYMSNVKTRIKADMDANMPNFKFTFKENEVQLNDLVLGFDGYFAMPKEDMEMDFKFKTKKADFKTFLSLIPGIYTKDFEQVKTTGSLALDGFVKGVYNEKVMPGFGLKVLIDKAMFKYPSLPKAVTNIYVNVDIKNKDGVPDHTIIDLHKLHFEMAQNPVDIKMHVSTPVSDPSIDGDIKGKIDLTSVKDFVPLEADQKLSGTIISDIALKGRMSSIDKKEYEKFDAKGQLIILDMNYQSKDIAYPVDISKAYFNFSPQVVELSSFDAKLGKSDMHATGKIENFLGYMFKDDLIKGAFSFNSSYMDLNELSGSSEESATEQTADTSSGVATVPANIDFVLDAKIAKLIYDNMDISDVSGKIIIRESKMSMDNIKLNTLGGSMVMSGAYDTKNELKPHTDLKLNINGFDIPQTYKTFNTVEKLAPIAKYATGKFSTVLEFAGDMDSNMDMILSTLAGYGKLVTQNVVVSGFEPFNKVADAIKMEKYKRLDLNKVNISFLFKDGKVNVEPFDIKIGGATVNVFGSNGFDQSINYTMGFDIPRSEMGSAANAAVNNLISQANSKGANLSAGERVKINALIGGTVTKPTVKVDMKGAVTNAVDDLKDKAKEELDKKKAELEAKAKDEVNKAKAEAEARARAEADKAKAEAEAKAKAESDRLKKEAEEKAKKEAEKKLKGIFGKPK